MSTKKGLISIGNTSEPTIDFQRVYMDVSKNRGAPKWIVYNNGNQNILKWMIWGYHYF